MEPILTLTTPSITFSAISLIMLAYTNRFLACAQLARTLKAEFDKNPTPLTKLQMDNLTKRLYLTRSMQVYGISSLIMCVICTVFIYFNLNIIAEILFIFSIVLLIISLSFSLKEIVISVKALEYHLNTMQE